MHPCTFELLGIAEQELVWVLHLQVEFNGLQQDPLQHHHLLLYRNRVMDNIVTMKCFGYRPCPSQGGKYNSLPGQGSQNLTLAT